MQKITKTNTIYWPVAGFLVGFFAIGYPYWQIPYAKLSLPNTLYGPDLFVIGAIAFAVRAFAQARLAPTIFIIGASVPAAVLVRVVVETTKDPTSHNLWPFEVIIAAVAGVVCSSAGVAIGSVAWLLSKRS